MNHNKLLAEYLEIYKEPHEDYKLPECFPVKLFTNEGDEWKPNRNWNHFMMIVKKIRDDKNIIVDSKNNKEKKLNHWTTAEVFDMLEEFIEIDEYFNAQIEDYTNACVEYMRFINN